MVTPMGRTGDTMMARFTIFFRLWPLRGGRPRRVRTVSFGAAFRNNELSWSCLLWCFAFRVCFFGKLIKPHRRSWTQVSVDTKQTSENHKTRGRIVLGRLTTNLTLILIHQTNLKTYKNFVDGAGLTA
jgi:hypothetical protein